MEAFTRLTAIAVPIELKNVNTDMIFPARFMRRPRDGRYASYLFHDRRFAADGTEHADFVLNRPAYRKARIIVGNTNFGCGSSRETAVYALHDYGIRALIAPSFGDIFAANCVRNGLLPIRLADDVCDDLRALAMTRPGVELTVDLARQEIAVPEKITVHFDVEPFDKECLLHGLDDVDVTLREEASIAGFETAYRRRFPWRAGGPA